MGAEAGLTTFAEARDKVLLGYGSAYPPAANFQVADYGFETEEFWIVLAGPYAQTGIPEGMQELWSPVDDGPQIRVDKATGEISEAWGPDAALVEATRVGTFPYPEDDFDEEFAEELGTELD